MASAFAFGQNFPTRRAMIANVCPHLKLSDFSFENYADGRLSRNKAMFAWENIGDKEIIAFEIVILKFDPFNNSMLGARGILPGHGSINFTPLKPGEKDSDGFLGTGSEAVYTAYAYVRSIRFADNTVWNASLPDLVASVKKQTPDILDPGPLVPPKKTADGGGPFGPWSDPAKGTVTG